MDDIAKGVTISVATYPFHLARTLMQIGYEPIRPDQNGDLPNIFTYISFIRKQRGYTSLYTGLGYYLPSYVLKNSTYNLMANVTNHKKESKNCDASEMVAVCLRESALTIQTTIITYPLVTLGIGYISAAFLGTKEPVEYTLASLYKGIIPKLIYEVTMVVVNIISRRITASFVDDELGQVIISRVPPFIIQSFMYPCNLVSIVMAEDGRSGVNPRFNNWRQCFKYLDQNNQLKRGSSIAWRKVKSSNGKRYF